MTSGQISSCSEFGDTGRKCMTAAQISSCSVINVSDVVTTSVKRLNRDDLADYQNTILTPKGHEVGECNRSDRCVPIFRPLNLIIHLRAFPEHRKINQTIS